MTIYKFPVPTVDRPLIDMPQGARLLHVAAQGQTVCLWAVVDPSAPMVSRRFRFAGTGHPLTQAEAAAPHIGTVLLAGGALVFHIFDLGEV